MIQIKKIDQKKFQKSPPHLRQGRRNISVQVDGGLSVGPSVRRQGSKDPHRHERKYSLTTLFCLSGAGFRRVFWARSFFWNICTLFKSFEMTDQITRNSMQTAFYFLFWVWYFKGMDVGIAHYKKTKTTNGKSSNKCGCCHFKLLIWQVTQNWRQPLEHIIRHIRHLE